MRVLHINRNYLSTALHQTMIEHLDKCGVESCVFAPTSKTDVVVIKPNKNVFESYCFNNFDRFFYSLKQFKIVRSIKKNIDVASFDVIHAYTLFTDGNAAMMLAEKYNKPFVVAVRDTDVNVFFAKLFYLRNRGIKIMRKAKKIFFLSETYRKQVFEKYVPQVLYDELLSKTEIIPNGIDDFWHEHQWNESKKISDPLKLIFAGQVSKRKNVHTIKNAMDILQHQGVKSTLTAIGKIVDQAEYDAIKDDDRITYLPAMPKEKLIEQYRTHDVFVMPSYRETFGLVYAEALSQGLPVVYSKGQGFDGQFEEGEVGYRCDAMNSNDLANAIEKIKMNYEKIQKKSVAASLKFRWSDICSKYKCVYDQLAKV